MMTVKEISRISGVSIRTLHYYDKIGLLPATDVTPAGYRLYDENALKKLQIILLYKELQFPLKIIKNIFDNPDFNKNEALEQQIHLLKLRIEHFEGLIDLAYGIKLIGEEKVSKMNFEVFDTKKIKEYEAQVKNTWGNTQAYKEYEKKSKMRSTDDEKIIGSGLMEIFAEFGKIKNESPESSRAQELVEKLRKYITENYYTCTVEILLSLGQMYSCSGEMTNNIDKYAGAGTAQYVSSAIVSYGKTV